MLGTSDLPPPPPPPPPERRSKSKPIWKQWWFWAIVVIIVIAAGAGISETTQTEAEAGSPSSVAPTTSTPPAPETAEVPNVGGKPIDVATSELEAAGFVVSVETRPTNAVHPGDVLEQSAYPGSLAEVGDTIALIVAKAPPEIPDIVGKTLANAKRMLKNAGFEVGKVRQQTSSRKKGTVIAQSPDAGTSAHPGREVSLVTAKPAP